METEVSGASFVEDSLLEVGDKPLVDLSHVEDADGDKDLDPSDYKKLAVDTLDIEMDLVP